MLSTRKAYKLDELGFVGRGKSKHRPRNDPKLYGGKYPFFQTGDVKNAELYLSRFHQTYNEIGLAQSKIWEPGTLCITIAANIAETCILKIRGCFPDSIVGFVPDANKADAKFVKYYIDTIKLNMQSVSRGTTQDNLSLEKLRSFDFMMPVIEEQRQIASILSTYDDLIENNTRRIAILEEMARRIYHEWFVNFRFPGHEKVKLVESELGKIPSGWEVKTIGDLINEDIIYKNQDGNHGAKHPKSEDYVSKGIPFIMAKDITSNLLCMDGCKNITLEQAEFLNKGFARPDDVLLTHKATMGRVAIAPNTHDLYVLSPQVTLFRVKDENKINQAFLYLLFLSERFQSILHNESEQSTRKYISILNQRNIKILLPEKEIMKDFQINVKALLSLRLKLQTKNIILRTARDLLLPKLISGQIDISELQEQKERIGIN